MSIADRFRIAAGLTRSVIIYYGQPWRRRALRRFYGQLISPGDLVFDIGAHIGNRSKTLAALGADVVAVEPQPAFAEFIKKFLAAGFKAFEQVAVGAEPGNITLKISSRHPTVTTVSKHFIEAASHAEGFRGVVWDREITVPMTTLDNLIERHGLPRFCKIDCEGAEADILRGLSRPLPLVAFEYVPAIASVAMEAVERLEALWDYRFNRVVGEQHRFVEDEWKSAGAILNDLAALPAGSASGDIYARLEPF